jgi:hypothetical protein
MNSAQQKRNLLRLEKEEEFKKFNVFIKIYKINNINFASVNSFKNLFIFHFITNDIPFINEKNYKDNSRNFIDFRSGIHFQKIFLTENKNSNFQNFIFYNLYFDSTNVSKNNNIEKKKNIFNCYLTFNNDILKKSEKKYTYNISSITESKLKTIGLNNYLYWLCSKLKYEVEEYGIYFIEKNIFAKAILLGCLGDNKEIYELIGFKLNFGRGNFTCRCCDNSKKEKNNTKNIIYNNQIYLHFIDMVKQNKNNFQIYNIKEPGEISNLFILKVFFKIYFIFFKFILFFLNLFFFKFIFF